MIFKVDGYESIAGDEPFADALTLFKSKSPKLHDRVLLWLDYIKDDQYHHMPHVELLGRGLYMLRVRHGRHLACLFFIKSNDRKVLLLNGFYKTSNKIPSNELDRARNLQAEIN